MIKFYKDQYSALTGMGPNAICFATDRKVILLDGHEYGKDQIKKVATSGEAANADVAVGTLFVVQGEQAIYEKTATGASAVLSSVTDALSALKEELSAIVSTAYTTDHVVLGSGTGITSSDFVLDTTSGALTGIQTTLSTTLVNAATLSAAVSKINENAAHVEGSTSGIAVLTGEPDANGTLYTVGIRLGSSTSSSLKFDAASGLIDDLKIAKLATATAGYAASYQLQTGDGVALGDTINIVKDQFLSGVELVNGTYDPSTGTFTPGSGADTNRYIKFVFNVNTDGDSTGEETPKQSTIYLDVNELFDSYTGVSGVAVNQATNQISAVVDGTTETGLGATKANHYNGAFLTVGADGLKVDGIKNEISGYIQDLGSTTIPVNQYVTQVGVNANGALTSHVATISASQVAFTSGGTISSTTVQAAIEEVAADVADLLSGLDVDNTGDTTTYIQSISETDGKISAVSAKLEADKVAYSTTFNGQTITETSGALKTIESTISGMDYVQTPSGTAPASGAATKYTIVNTVGEVDGKISATTIDLTAANTYAAGITENLGTESAPVAATAARVAITQGTQDNVNDQISNILADYLSFHKADGSVI